MAFRLKAGDYELLKAISECRIMTVTQLAVLFNKKKQSLSRRLRALEKQDLVVITPQEFGRGRGRPENLISLDFPGVEVLKDNRDLTADVHVDAVMADNIHCKDHQLLLNWCRLHLNYIQTVMPRLKIQFLSHNSPFLKELSRHPLASDFAPVKGSSDEMTMSIPDSVVSITDSVTSQTLLYFLEVDCGTETIASLKRKTTDIRQKILNYGAYFDNGRYKRYEEVWKCKLEGFRLLFVCNTPERMAGLCKLVREMPPSDFIWVTEQSQMFEQGISAAIWACGGVIESAPESILDDLCCRAPLPL